MTINKPYLPKTKTFLKKNKLLSYFLFFPILLLGLAFTFWVIQSKESIDVKEKEILLVEPPSQSATTQTTHIKPMWRYNPQHTGVSPYIGPAKKPELEWSIKIGKSTLTTPTIASDGTVYIASYRNTLYALTPEGTVKWTHATDGHGIRHTTSPAIAPDGTVYIGAFLGSLYSLTPEGTLKWKYPIRGLYSSPVIAPDGTIYVGNLNGIFWAINPNKTTKWFYKIGTMYSSPAIAPDGTVYIANVGGSLYALTPEGTLKWKYNTGGKLYSSPAIASDGTIYIGLDSDYVALDSNYIALDNDALNADNYLYAINPGENPPQRLKWKYKLARVYGSSPAISPDEKTTYIRTYGYIYALNTSDGSLKWTYPTGGCADPSSPVIDTQGNIFFGTNTNNLFALSPKGELLWKINDAKTGIIKREIALDNCGNIYVANFIDVCWYKPTTLTKWKNPAVQPQKADLSITKQDNPDPVKIESLLTYTLIVTNNGPDTAGQVQVTDTLSGEEFYFNSASSSQGTCNHASGIVTCSLGSMASGTQATVTIDGYVYGLPQGNKLINKAVVSSSTNDPDSSNNQAEEDTWVHEYSDPSPSPSPNPDCHKADYDNNGKIDTADLAVFLSYWGTSNPSGDFNNDNVVNAADLAIFLSYWGPCE